MHYPDSTEKQYKRCLIYEVDIESYNTRTCPTWITRHSTPSSLLKQDQVYSRFFSFFYQWKVSKRQLSLKTYIVLCDELYLASCFHEYPLALLPSNPYSIPHHSFSVRMI